jgi:HSP20 family protein
MSAQQSKQQSGSTEIQRGSQPSGLTRRAQQGGWPSLFWDPLDIFMNPFSMFRRMQDEMFRTLAPQGAGRGDISSLVAWAPAVDVTYRDNNLVVSAELPGLSEEDVKVEIVNDVLILRGERRSEREEEESGVRRSEIRYGEFYRAIPLPEDVDAQNARAEFQNGILQITIPVSQKNVHKIPVTATGPQRQAGPQVTRKEEEKAA